MFQRFNLFSKWYCPDCNSVLKRKNIKYQSDFNGMYTTYWFRCLKCGETHARTYNSALKELLLKNYND